MKFLNGLLGLAVLGFGYKLLSTAKAALTFEYGISSYVVNLKKTGISNGLVGTLGFSIYNPTEKNVTYQRFVGNILYQGSRVGNIDPAGIEQQITARQNTIVPLTITIPASVFGYNGLDIITKLLTKQKLTFSKKFRIVGFIKIQNLPDIPVDFEFDLGQYI